MQGSCQHRCPPFFWTPLTRIDLKNTQPFRSRAFCAGRIPATPGNANCAESRGGRGRFAKRSTTGPCRNGRDCLNAATVLDCAARARIRWRQQKFAHFAGWLVSALARGVKAEAETHHHPGRQLIDIAFAFSLAAVVKGEGGEALEFSCPVDFILEAHFRLKSDIAPMFVSRSTCRAVPSRGHDETIVQQPSC
jgi:hypothetical protein